MLSRVVWTLPLVLGTVSVATGSFVPRNDSVSVNTAVSTETGSMTSPFHTPTQTPVSGLFPVTDPRDPPSPANASVIPDFAPAWAVAYQKAKTRVSRRFRLLFNIGRYPFFLRHICGTFVLPKNEQP